MGLAQAAGDEAKAAMRAQADKIAVEMDLVRKDELEALNADDEAVDRLGEELAAYARHYQEKAAELSQLRRAAAPSVHRQRRDDRLGGARADGNGPAFGHARRPATFPLAA